MIVIQIFFWRSRRGQVEVTSIFLNGNIGRFCHKLVVHKITNSLICASRSFQGQKWKKKDVLRKLWFCDVYFLFKKNQQIDQKLTKNEKNMEHVHFKSYLVHLRASAAKAISRSKMKIMVSWYVSSFSQQSILK